jgi:hypothetical protein
MPFSRWISALVPIVFAASLAPQPALADTNPCTLIPQSQAAALSAGSGAGDWHHHVGNSRYSQETCHYPGPPNRELMVAVHLDAAPFASVKMMTKPLPGIGADATWFAATGVIAFLKHGTYVSMSWMPDAGKATPSAAYVAAAKAAAAKL